MFWVYVLENPRGKFYVGQTENIAERVKDHNRTDSFDGHFTRKNGPCHLRVSEVLRSLVATRGRIVELLNFLSEYGEKARRGAVTQAEGVLSGANIEVAPQSHEAFMAGLTLYKARPDKGYSLTDCIRCMRCVSEASAIS